MYICSDIHFVQNWWICMNLLHILNTFWTDFRWWIWFYYNCITWANDVIKLYSLLCTFCVHLHFIIAEINWRRNISPSISFTLTPDHSGILTVQYCHFIHPALFLQNSLLFKFVHRIPSKFLSKIILSTWFVTQNLTVLLQSLCHKIFYLFDWHR